MFENLSERLERSFKILKGQGSITEINVAETLKDIRKALIDADVNYKVAKTFTDEVKEKALGQDVLTSLQPGQLMVKIVHDELARLMGGTTVDVNIKANPAIILMSGLQGSGKTTFSGKLASMLKSKRGKNPLLVACDIYRPAAIDQLKVLGEQIGVPVYAEIGNKDAVEIAKNAVKFAKQNNHGITHDVYDIVYVKPESFNAANNRKMVDEIDAINRQLLAEERGCVLIGPGRWGTNDPCLGIPVKWPHISSARLIVEAGLTNYRIDPSQGTHFFQNLTSFGVGYFTVNPYIKEGYLDFGFLDAQPAIHETENIRHVRFDRPVTIKIDGRKSRGVVLKPLKS